MDQKELHNAICSLSLKNDELIATIENYSHLAKVFIITLKLYFFMYMQIFNISF